MIAAALDADEVFRGASRRSDRECPAGACRGRPHRRARPRRPIRSTPPSSPTCSVRTAGRTSSPRPTRDGPRSVGRPWRRRAQPKLARLRAEVTELRAQLRSRARRRQARRRHEAIAAATAEIADLRKQLRARTGELRAAQRAETRPRQAAVAATRAGVGGRAQRARPNPRRSRARIAELERAVESARRAVRAPIATSTPPDCGCSSTR